MFLTVHATVGALIGQHSPNILVAFVLGIISHYIVDAIPHGDENLIGEDKANITKKEILLILKIVSLDVIIMSSLLYCLYSQGLINPSWTIISGIIGSILPDFFNGIYLLTKNKFLKKSSMFHFNLHFITGKTISLKAGLVVQLIILSLIILIATIV
jgi:hypothetical protein